MRFCRLIQSSGGEGRVAPRLPLFFSTIIFTFPGKKTRLMAALVKGDASLSGSAPPSSQKGRGYRTQMWVLGPNAASLQKGLIRFNVFLPATFSRLISKMGRAAAVVVSCLARERRGPS